GSVGDDVLVTIMATGLSAREAPVDEPASETPPGRERRRRGARTRDRDAAPSAVTLPGSAAAIVAPPAGSDGGGLAEPSVGFRTVDADDFEVPSFLRRPRRRPSSPPAA
ncbi:MAG TPA: hypothetical protein VFJ71_00405, partial [Candidatus Limnocylindrales bacterium]|nr:hypothetical protein [Candidatus Limnocylindrales bacterium]